MKKVNLQNLLRSIGIIPLVLISVISALFFYLSFNKYQEVTLVKHKVELSNAINEVSIALNKEMAKTSIFFASHGQFPLSKKPLELKRKVTNVKIKELKKLIVKYSNLNNPSLQRIISNLTKIYGIRKKIDNFNIKFQDWFFNYYVRMNTILNDYNNNLLKNHCPQNIFMLSNIIDEKIQKDLILEQLLNNDINAIGIQRGYLSYLTTINTPMSEKAYKAVFFTYFVNTNSLKSLLSSIPNTYRVLNSKKFKKNSTNYTSMLFSIQKIANIYFKTNEFESYLINPNEIYTILSSKTMDLIKINYFISDDVNNHLKTIHSNYFNLLLFSGAFLILSLLLFIIYVISNKNGKADLSELNELIEKLLPIANQNNETPLEKPKNLKEAYIIINKAIENTLRLSEESKEGAKAKSMFLANMSHEIRTPLNGILGFLELLENTELNDEQFEYVDTITTSANSLLEIINSILDISKIEPNKVELELVAFKPLNEFEDTIEIFGARAADKEIDLISYIDPNIPMTLKGDILKLKEVITNLLSNAVKFTHSGYISLKIELKELNTSKAKLYFEVKDSGIGVSEEQKDKIFEAFSQADVSITRKYGGTGLGLAISQKYIELMNSKIELTSTLNKGSKFFFEIELEVVDTQKSIVPNSFENLNIAILDSKDNHIKVNYLKKYLNYANANSFYFSDLTELERLHLNHSLNGVILVYDLIKDIDFISYLQKDKLKYTTIASLKNKSNIDNFSYKPIFSVWDPMNPHKIFSMLEEIDNSRLDNYTKVIESINKKEEVEKFDLKVLVAEDNPINQKLIKITLEQMDIEVSLANNGLEVFNSYNKHPKLYDLIFMDIQMPVMDGIEATREILEFEKEEELPHTPIIALTANALKGDRERFLDKGMDEYLAKPINKIELVNIIKKFAEHKIKKDLLQSTTQEELKENDVKLPIFDTNKNIIIARKNKLEINILKNYLEEFEFKNIHSINAINELGQNISLETSNILFIDKDFVDNFEISKVAAAIRAKIKNIEIITFDDIDEIENIDIVLPIVNKQTLLEILPKKA